MEMYVLVYVWEVWAFRHADVVFVYCVHLIAVPNAAFCMTISLLMLVEDARSDHMEEAYSGSGVMTALSVSFCFPHPVAVSVIIICRGLCGCTEML